MTGQELFDSLKKEGLENLELIYPNWSYQTPTKHNAHVINWRVENGEIFLQIDIKEELKRR